MPSSSRAVFASVAVLALVACDDRPRVARVLFPAEAVLERQALAQLRLENPTIAGLIQSGRRPDAPPPVPNRLVVKIDGDHLKPRYCVEATAVAPIDPGMTTLRDALGASAVEELGASERGRATYRLRLESPVTATKVLEETEGTPYRARLDGLRPGTLTAVVVESTRATGAAPRPGGDPFPQLEDETPLRGLLSQVGVASIRRVFRSFEAPDGPGCYRVRSTTELHTEISQRFPVRGSRGYPDLQVPSNMEGWFLLRLRPEADLEEAFGQLEGGTGVVQVSHEYRGEYHQEPQDEPDYGSQWALHDETAWGIDVQPAWPETEGNQPVVVAVIGSGIHAGLDELTDRMWTNPDEDPGDGDDEDGNGYVDDVDGITTDDTAAQPGQPGLSSPHETQVAGILAARSTNGVLIAGVAGKADVRLMNIHLGGPGPLCNELAEAILYAAAEGADVINMSLGAPGQAVLSEAVTFALTSGVGATLVASAGNDKQRASQNYVGYGAQCPACFQGVIAVGGTDQNGHLWSEPGSSQGSNYGVVLDVVAPAKDVPTITYTDPSQTAAESVTMTGTSASAPLVSGVAALLLGKYPTVRLEFLRHWLRATSLDITDPLGDGGVHEGDDIYTGAGLVSASGSLTQGDPDPIVVSVFVEKIGNGPLNGYVSNAVAGRPDLGLTVLGPLSGAWSLHVGVGDDPSVWSPVAVPLGTAQTSGFETEMAMAEDGWFFDVEEGHDYLDTDTLANRQIYTIRITAQDAAGRTYTDYDWFMPVRAMIQHPAKSTVVSTRWGWPIIDGLVDSRPNTFYTAAVLRENYTTDESVYNNVLVHEGPSRGSNFGVLVVPDNTLPSIGSPALSEFPMFDLGPVGEGPRILRVVPWGPAGMLFDDQEVYVDGTYFGVRSGFPVGIPQTGGTSVQFIKGLDSGDVDGSGSHRLFVQHRGRFLSLDTAGNIVWDQSYRLFQESSNPPWHGPGFALEDLDGDGDLEIALGAVEFNSGAGVLENIVTVINASDASPVNANWPVRMPYYAQDWSAVGNVRTGDVDGDGTQDIVFYQRAFDHGDHIPESEVPASERGIGRIHVLDLDGQPKAGWPVDRPKKDLDLQLEDVDGDGDDEILVGGGDELLDGDGTTLPGWPPTDPVYGNTLAIPVREPGVGVSILQYGHTYENGETRYFADLRSIDGQRRSGAWPLILEVPVTRISTPEYNSQSISRVFARARRLVAGGAMQMVLCHDLVTAYEIDGSVSSLLSPITLDGECWGVDVLDVDGDGAREVVALVLHFSDDDGWAGRAYYDLGAWELDGTALSATDPRWPIRVGFNFRNVLGNSVLLRDIDGNGDLEFVNLMMKRYAHGRVAYRLDHPPIGWIDVLDLP